MPTPPPPSRDPSTGDAAGWSDAIKKLSDAADKLTAAGGSLGGAPGTPIGAAIPLALAAASTPAPPHRPGYVAPWGIGTSGHPGGLGENPLPAPVPRGVKVPPFPAPPAPAAWPSMLGALAPKVVKAAKSAKGPTGGALGAAAMGKLAAQVGPLGPSAMARLGSFSPPVPPPLPPAPARGKSWFGRQLDGLSRAGGPVADTFPGTAFGRMGRRASRMKLVSAGLGKAAAGAKAAGAGTMAAGLGGMSALAGKGAMLAGGPVGVAVAAIATVGGAAVDFGKAIHGMAREALRVQEQLGHASGSMAAVMAERSNRDTMRDLHQGQQLARSARELSRSEGDVKDEAAKIETLALVIKNRALAGIEDALASILKPLAKIADQVTKAIEGDPKDFGIAPWLRAVAEETEREIARADAAYTRPDVTVFRP